jgi:hypothetical protein
MHKRFKKIAAFLSLAVLSVGVLFWSGQQLEQSKLAKFVKKSLGIKTTESAKVQTAQAETCVVQQKEDDKSALFIGCNGFF